MTVWIAWAAEDDAEVRAAYDALAIGETIQRYPETDAEGRLMVGSGGLTLEQAQTLPQLLHAGPERPSWWVPAPDETAT